MDINFYFKGFYADLARWHEEGAGHLPERKHLSLFIEKYQKKLFQSYLKKNYKTFLNNEESFLKGFGNYFIHHYRAWMIAGNVKPELQEKTIERKQKMGSATPRASLVLSGTMINALTFEVA